jgi:hypothetical protein
MDEPRRVLTRGLEKVRAEFSLTALAYNMTRVLKIVGIERLLKVFKNAKQPSLFDSVSTLLPSLPYRNTSPFFPELSVHNVSTL